jgi:hypothetical protein
MAAQVLFFKPRAFSNEWARAESWQSATAIPNVAVSEDADGEQARLFGAQTSGYVLLYDPRGHLLFSGGITASRGHAGDNAGESAILSILDGQHGPVTETRVYGCSLSSKCEALPKETVQ